MTSKCPLISDASFNFSSFDAARVSSSTRKLNDDLFSACQRDAKWWEIGAEAYRQLRAEGKAAFPAYKLLEQAGQLRIPSRQDGREIECRVFKPAKSGNQPRGIFLHIHGGGFVLGTAKGQDLFLSHICEHTNIIIVSVEYRLAPEHVYPAAVEDCQDVASWLIKHSRDHFDAELWFIGGESAGATLAASTLLAMRQQDTHKTIKGIILNYGCFDFTMMPSVRLAPDTSPILGYEDADRFLSTYLKGMTYEDRKNGNVSVLYNDLSGLPPAFILVGTEDALIDDSVLLHFRWRRAGNDAVLKFVPGAPHGFMVFDGSTVEVTATGWQEMVAFLQWHTPR